MNDKIEVPTMQVPPLKRICMTIGQLPSSYLETMSYYEMLVWFVNYLRDDIIPVVNANGLATQELQELFVELQKYVNDYFDNLDVQEEINNKLDEMLKDGVLNQIIEQYLNSTALWCYDTVNDMKLATNLIEGSYVRTLGFHEIGDGGGAIYRINTITNEDVVNNMDIIPLTNNTLIAKLVYSDVNIKQFGAYGDNDHDDYEVISYCLTKTPDYKLILPRGTYKITQELDINGIEIFIDGENANINYTGTEYALNSHYLRFATIKIGNITANNGGCIKWTVLSSDDQFVYDNIYFRTFTATTNCVYAHCEGGGWINEIRWFNGKLTAGQIGFNIEHDFMGQWANNAINGWHFNNIGIEGVTTGFYLNAISGRITQFNFNGLRNAESFTTLLKTSGTVDRCSFNGSNMIIDTWLDLSENTNNINLFVPVQINNIIQPSGFIDHGILAGNKNVANLTESSIELVANQDLNNLLTPGTYSSNSNQVTTSLTNKPTEVTNGACKITVTELTSNLRNSSSTTAYIVQMLYNNENIYKRFIENRSGTLYPTTWKKLEIEKNSLLVEGGTSIEWNKDLNTLIKPGSYTSNTNAQTQSLTNLPSSITGGALRIIVIETTNTIRESNPSTAYLTQIIIQEDKIFIRKLNIYNSVTSAGSWKQITTA